MSKYQPAADRRDGNAVRHINPRHLAARWGLSVRTLERWRSLRQGPPFLKLGGRVTYRLEDIEAYEAAQRQEMRAS
jgi:predicted DNA-binding transcriptional regulator AlpA